MTEKPDRNEYLRTLQQAFEQFNTKTEDLTKAYAHLQKRASKIDKELARKNIQLKKKNIQLNQTTHYLDNLIKSMPSALIALDGCQCIEAINPAAAKLFCLREKEIMKKPVKKMAIFKPLYPLIEETIKGFPAISQEVLLAVSASRRDESILVEVSTSRIMDKNKLMGILIILRDLTEIKDLRGRIVRSENLALLGQMAVTVAHEIRNPLGGVQGFASLLKKDLKDDPKKRELVEKILIGTHNLNSFITDLLDFAKPLKVIRKKEPLADIVNKAIMFSLNYPKDMPHQVRIKKVFSKAIVQNIDGHLLFRLLLNILNNAYEAMGGKGTCEIHITRADKIRKQKRAGKIIKSINYCEGYAFSVISIKDSGPGIEPDFMEQIFNPFVTSKNFGTGLGLSMVQRIIEALNGRIDVFSIPGKGTEFKIYIPRDS